jgi:hypothetical protein
LKRKNPRHDVGFSGTNMKPQRDQRKYLNCEFR